MDEEVLVAVSPRHSVRLAREYQVLLERPPQKDFVVRTITKREAQGMPLVAAEIVIGCEATRQAFPLARQYPLHFRKTYFPGRLHGDPKEEFDRQQEASEILGLPPPIGHTPDTFRNCLLPGTPYNRLSPFTTDTEEGNVSKARKLALATAAGLYYLLEAAFNSVSKLHQAGMAHGDAELHNFIVCPSPLEMLVIDFEAAARRDALGDEAFEERLKVDFDPLLREAVFLQCSLGPQQGALADLARARLDKLFKNPERFRREMDENESPRA
ncbi:MAG: lipopolysaccharide kinase InaA family protein [Polyangiaceae bacterium]